MTTQGRVLCTALAATMAAPLAAFVEIMIIGAIGGNTEGTGLVALGLAPFAAVIGTVVVGIAVWRRTRARATPGDPPTR